MEIGHATSLHTAPSRPPREALRAAIIGCGAMAHGYDAHAGEPVYTHAKAYALHPATTLVGACDVDAAAAQACAGRWGGRAFTDAARMLAEVRPDVVSICSPTAWHLDHLALCLDFPVRAVWCEKPLAAGGQDPEPVVRAYERDGRLLAVNYIRRWEPQFVRVGEEIASGRLGEVRRAVAHYSKGFLHSGSHFVDLFTSWFGPVADWQVLDGLVDVWEDDPTLDVRLTFESGVQAFLLGGDDRHYSLDEVDVFAEKARIRFTGYSAFVSRSEPVAEPLTGAFSLPADAAAEPTEMPTLMLGILDNLVEALHGRAAIPSTGATALATLSLCRAIAAAAPQPSI